MYKIILFLSLFCIIYSSKLVSQVSEPKELIALTNTDDKNQVKTWLSSHGFQYEETTSYGEKYIKHHETLDPQTLKYKIDDRTKYGWQTIYLHYDEIGSINSHRMITLYYDDLSVYSVFIALRGMGFKTLTNLDLDKLNESEVLLELGDYIAYMDFEELRNKWGTETKIHFLRISRKYKMPWKKG